MSDLATKITDVLLRDLTGRNGFDAVWDQADEEIQLEMRSEWRALVQAKLDAKAGDSRVWRP